MVLAVALVYPMTTYVQVLVYPGQASFTARTVDWLRQMGLDAPVNAIENWWYTRKQPGTGAPAATALPPTRTPTVAAPGARPSDLVVHSGLAGEGVWVPGARAADGTAALYTTFVRPDPRHGSVVAGVAWLNQDLTAATLVPGTREPGGSVGPDHAVPLGMRSSLLATFNSGFKMRDANGGCYLNGTTIGTLRDGAAAVVLTRDGRVGIGQWGRDHTLGPDVIAVRQNLDLVIDRGQPVPGLDQNTAEHWGNARNQFQYTWRSGLGLDSHGNLLYVGGDQLTLHTLADAMRQAGVVRGMELDIHTGMVVFTAYRPDSPGTSPTRLLPGMSSPPDRYLVPDQRDFFAIALRAPRTHASTLSP
ncbi:phosphodiester glycosidase family protein [Actinokineospora diospyrosa]